MNVRKHRLDTLISMLMNFRVYVHYPDNMVHWFQECMPEGYTQKRVIRYSRINGSDSIDEEGTMTTFHTVRLEKEMVYGKESWICTNNVVLSANFKAGSPLLQSEALTFSHPSSLEKCMPDGNGLKNYCQFVSHFLFSFSIITRGDVWYQDLFLASIILMKGG